MFFNGIKYAVFDGENLHLSKDGKKSDYKMEPRLCQLIFVCRSFRFSRNVDFDYDLFTPDVGEGKPNSLITGSAFLTNRDKVAAFHESNFLGCAEQFEITIKGGDQNFARFNFWAADDDHHTNCAYLSVLLKNDLLERVFDPMWKIVPTPELSIIVGINAFEWGPEGSFKHHSDPSHYVVKSGSQQAQLRHIYLANRPLEDSDN